MNQTEGLSEVPREKSCRRPLNYLWQLLMKAKVIRFETCPTQVRIRISSAMIVVESWCNALKEVTYHEPFVWITQITKQYGARSLVGADLQDIPDNSRFALRKIDGVEELCVASLKPARNGLSALADISRTIH